jgi:hypothetical protein
MIVGPATHTIRRPVSLRQEEVHPLDTSLLMGGTSSHERLAPLLERALDQP